MPQIALPEGIPGIRSALAFRPETAGPLLDLAEVLLRGENTLTRGERELSAAAFCMFNRYVDGLATWTPTDPEAYAEMARRVVDRGYVAPVGA
jgi:hypothetical protein